METEYKLCKRGHVRSPENLNKRRECKECIKHRDQTPERKEYQKKYNQLPTSKEYQKKYQPEKHKERKNSSVFKEYRKKHTKDQVDLLTDTYVRHKLGLKTIYAPPEILELKRLQITLKRELKKCKQSIQ